MTELSFHRAACWAMIAVGVLVAVTLRFVSAPYGRHARGGWGPSIPSRAGWILMESPACLAFAGIYLTGDHRAEVSSIALLCLWQLHYVHRAFVFPFRMRLAGKTMPLTVALMAFFFNWWNAYINARWISQLGDYGDGWVKDPRFLVGAAVFLVGMGINLQADTSLMRLRRPGETGYRVPKGGLFEIVACPNYFGEIVEWCGWAVAAWSLSGVAFAVFTAANVGPRAFSHRAWYRATFPDYPRERKALIPFLW